MVEVCEFLETLGNPMNENKFTDLMKNIDDGDSNYAVILQKLDTFVKFFRSYLKSEEFKIQIFKIIKLSLDICDEILDLDDLLIKTAVVNFIELYLNYSKISGMAKESVLNTLGLSFGVLAPGAQILSICVMVDPILNSPEFRENREKIEDVEVNYEEHKDSSTIQSEIKKNIDNWIRALNIDLDKQDYYYEKLRKELKKEAEKYKLDTLSQEFVDIGRICEEMLRMLITSLALMSEIDDDDLGPVPIN